MLFSVVTDKQLCSSGLHLERTYEGVKPREPKIFKIGHSPAQQLLPSHVNSESQVVYRKVKGEELTVDVKRNASAPYND